MVYLILIVGFFMLIKGADFFVDGCCSVAEKLGIPSMIVGLTVVAMGTSAPEASVSIAASLKESAGIAVGNIVGSNIFNLLFIVGICLLFVNMEISAVTIKRDFPWFLVSSILLIVMVYDGILGRLAGTILLIGMAAYIFVLVRSALKTKQKPETNSKQISTAKTVFYVVLGLVAVVMGGDMVVDAARSIATSFGFSEQFIGLSIVAMGTSLPELVTSIAAIRKNEVDLAIGNVIGSNIFNTLFVLGAAALVRPVPVGGEALVDLIICTLVSLVVYGMCCRKRELNKYNGLAMLLIYNVFFLYILMR